MSNYISLLYLLILTASVERQNYTRCEPKHENIVTQAGGKGREGGFGVGGLVGVAALAMKDRVEEALQSFSDWFN